MGGAHVAPGISAPAIYLAPVVVLFFLTFAVCKTRREKAHTLILKVGSPCRNL